MSEEIPSLPTEPSLPTPAPASLEARRVVPIIPEKEYEDDKAKVAGWGGAVLGLLAVIFLLIIAIAVMLAVILAKEDPIPDQSQVQFEWRTWEGRNYNNMTAGNMMFALWSDGNAYVMNLHSGEIVNPPSNSSQYSQNLGSYMTLADGELKIFWNGTNTPAAIAKAATQNSSSFTLNLLPTGVLFWKSSDGKISPVVWESATVQLT